MRRAAQCAQLHRTGLAWMARKRVACRRRAAGPVRPQRCQGGGSGALQRPCRRLSAMAAALRVLARERGAIPVLVTPVARRKFDGTPTARYARSVSAGGSRSCRGRGRRAHRPCRASMDWLRALGDAPSKPYFMHVPRSGRRTTRISAAGAQAVACPWRRAWRAVDAAAPVKPVSFDDCVRSDIAIAGVSPPRSSGTRHRVEPTRLHEGEGTTRPSVLRRRHRLRPGVPQARADPGAAIGAHVNDKDGSTTRSGRGELTLNGAVRGRAGRCHPDPQRRQPCAAPDRRRRPGDSSSSTTHRARPDRCGCALPAAALCYADSATERDMDPHRWRLTGNSRWSPAPASVAPSHANCWVSAPRC